MIVSIEAKGVFPVAIYALGAISCGLASCTNVER